MTPTELHAQSRELADGLGERAMLVEGIAILDENTFMQVARPPRSKEWEMNCEVRISAGNTAGKPSLYSMLTTAVSPGFTVIVRQAKCASSLLAHNSA